MNLVAVALRARSIVQTELIGLAYEFKTLGGMRPLARSALRRPMIYDFINTRIINSLPVALFTAFGCEQSGEQNAFC